MKQANLHIREIFNRFYLAIETPISGRVTELCTRPIDSQAFALAYWIEENTHIE